MLVPGGRLPRSSPVEEEKSRTLDPSRPNRSSSRHTGSPESGTEKEGRTLDYLSRVQSRSCDSYEEGWWWPVSSPGYVLVGSGVTRSEDRHLRRGVGMEGSRRLVNPDPRVRFETEILDTLEFVE